MTELATRDAYGVLIEPATLKIERLVPGPIERVWAYLTDSELRRKWLAAGAMEMKVGTAFELVWRNDELSSPPGQRPPGFSEEHRMESQIIALDPPRKLTFAWNGSGEVSFELTPQGEDVLLTVIHRRLPDRTMLLKVAAGWHAHLDILVARVNGVEPAPFWEGWMRLRGEYEGRILG
ncbi:SRPBCC family protein [Methylocella silvestris]|uniref:ATPase n=1 Tax=Methylocella silvestris TaxID=199596 RepID=A0A2J7THN8_METSI|nr:SRPBCC family protein [Methylocella silvestris]PNG26285.1 ATPase [Methylocella silvestris]